MKLVLLFLVELELNLAAPAFARFFYGTYIPTTT
jgi:hypothetical protein